MIYAARAPALVVGVSCQRNSAFPALEVRLLERRLHMYDEDVAFVPAPTSSNALPLSIPVYIPTNRDLGRRRTTTRDRPSLARPKWCAP